MDRVNRNAIPFSQRLDVREVSCVVNEAGEMYRVLLGKTTDLMKRPNLVSFIGRVWDAMSDVQDIHGYGTNGCGGANYPLRRSTDR